ncbi:MAG: hypothetical protein VB127_09015, partial [Sphaerochaeta sp.]|nr:hypothetical protein [Sphaerochaeta sp.]
MIMLIARRNERILKNILYILFFCLITIIFIFPMAYVFGNSFRNTQAIWRNAYPFTMKSFFTAKDFTMDGYLYSLGLTDTA